MLMIRTAQERAMVGMSLLDHIPNAKIRSRTKVADEGMWIARLKWLWAELLVRKDYGRWMKVITECTMAEEADNSPYCQMTSLT